MDLHEFELRYRAYSGLNNNFVLGRDQSAIMELVKISDRGTPDKQIQELSPEELRGITIQTYTEYKIHFLTEQGSQKIGQFTLQAYVERLEYELKVIKEMKFNSYFLIVSDFVSRAKENNIVVGPGRGSGAGSLLARTIKITDVDPLPYKLLFERFLNPARISMPDFDIDFEDSQRDKVIDYVKDKYGQDKVCAIGTYMQLATRAAFKDAARAVGVPFDKANIFSALIPNKISLQEALEDKTNNGDLIALHDSDEKIKQAADLSKQLTGNMRQLGVHACGIIIAPQAVVNYTPVQYVQNSTMQVSQYDGPTLEYIGLLKMDFLGLRNLSVIKNCIKIIKKKFEKEGKELPDMFKQFFIDTSFQPELTDTQTYENVFQTGDTTGIFQFEGGGMRRFLVQLKANNINDLVAMSALYRPGPMEFIPSYIRRKHQQEEIAYMHNDLKRTLAEKYGEQIVQEETEKLTQDLDPILGETYGIAVYQEQLMFLVQAMAGFSLAEADNLRKGVGKKIKAIIDKVKPEFISKCESFRNYKKETAERTFEKMIEPAASYSFNKSHSVCYALIAYQTAYLKAHYPVEFYASLIRSVEEDTDTLSTFIYETQQHGITVKNPDINESFNHVAAVQNYVRLGFVCIKGIGSEVGEFMQEERKKNGPFKTLETFLDRCSQVVNKKSLEGLIKAGALDHFADRAVLLHNLKTLLERSKTAKTMDQGLFGGTSTSQLTLTPTTPASFMDKLFMEQEVLKSFISGHPLDGLYPFVKKFTFISTLQNLGPEQSCAFIIVAYIKNISRAKKKGFFMQIEDLSGTTEIFFKDTANLKKFDIIIIHGFKGRGRTIDKIIQTSREKLVEQAQKANKYDPELTTIQVRKMRSQQEKSEIIEQAVQDLQDQTLAQTTDKITETPSDNKEVIQDQIQKPSAISYEPGATNHSPSAKEPIQTDIFAFPTSAYQIQKLITILQSEKGDIPITIGDTQYQVSKTGFKQIQELLTKE